MSLIISENMNVCREIFKLYLNLNVCSLSKPGVTKRFEAESYLKATEEYEVAYIK